MDMTMLMADSKLLVAWGVGASMGYGFALKTTLKAANDRIAELKAEMAELKDRLQFLEDDRYQLAREKNQ